MSIYWKIPIKTIETTKPKKETILRFFTESPKRYKEKEINKPKNADSYVSKNFSLNFKSPIERPSKKPTNVIQNHQFGKNLIERKYDIRIENNI